MLTRRALMLGAASSLATAAAADAPLTSLRPILRSPGGPLARVTTAEMIAQAGLGGTVGFVIADATTGEVLERVDGAVPLPPASVTKAVTALFAIEALGHAHRFETHIFADGEINDGILDGNLILAGGGDPNLVTDHLADLASRLKSAGVKEVTGDFLVWDRALTNLDEIDVSQLDYASYNPSVTGLNLNFNRVHFEWKQAGAAYDVTMDARSETRRPPVKMARMQVVDRRSPLFTYQRGDNMDQWTVARAALGGGGARWLPVRYPAIYAGEVFATLAAAEGIKLKPPKETADPPDGPVLASYESVPLTVMMRDMLLYSTNITAEAAGLYATGALTGRMEGLRASADCMSRWIAGRAGVSPRFVDHSGLGDASRVTAVDMVKMLSADRVAGTLRPIMKTIDMVDENRRLIRDHPGEIRAKTGTLNFVSSLAGYVRNAGGRDLAFAFFAADLEARERGKAAGGEQPPGAVSFNSAAKRLQQRILQRWAASGV